MTSPSNDMIELRDKLREEQRQKNRALMPNLAALVDEFREQFPDSKLIWGKDLVTGHEVGKKPEIDPDKVFTVPKDYYPSRSLNLKKGR
jgi:hypothetical protein